MKVEFWGQEFNPNMIDSVKFSNGIIPVKYGNVMSGLIEVNSVNPNEGLKIDAVVSTTTTEVFAQIPLWQIKQFLHITVVSAILG